MLSEEQWRELGRRHGLDLVEVKPFTRRRLFGLLMDIEYQGFYCPPRMAERVARLLLPVCGREAEEPPAFDDAFNVFLNFRKN